MKYWEDGQPNNLEGDRYNLYKIEDLSFGYFISNLIEDSYIAYKQKPIPSSLREVLYPIENTKEAHKIDTLYIENS